MKVINFNAAMASMSRWSDALLLFDMARRLDLQPSSISSNLLSSAPGVALGAASGGGFAADVAPGSCWRGVFAADAAPAFDHATDAALDGNVFLFFVFFVQCV